MVRPLTDQGRTRSGCSAGRILDRCWWNGGGGWWSAWSSPRWWRSWRFVSAADDAVGNVVLAGELRFDAQQRCFHLVAGDEPVGVVWPARFIGKVEPPRITDEEGSTVVALGDRVEVRGRYVSGAGDECGPVDADSSGFIASGDIVLVGG